MAFAVTPNVRFPPIADVSGTLLLRCREPHCEAPGDAAEAFRCRDSVICSAFDGIHRE
jgi:hypothetical protein